MLDSESQLREAIQKMLKSDTAGAAPAAGVPAAAAPDGVRKIKFYRSTMMPSETSPNPGKDSMGMDMVPVYQDGAADSAAGHQP